LAPRKARRRPPQESVLPMRPLREEGHRKRSPRSRISGDLALLPSERTKQHLRDNDAKRFLTQTKLMQVRQEKEEQVKEQWRNSIAGAKRASQRHSVRRSTANMTYAAAASSLESSERFDHFFLENVMRQWPLFNTCNKLIVEELAREVVIKCYEPGHVLAEEGDAATELIIVLKGLVEGYCGDVKVKSFGSGSYVGEVHLLGIEQNRTISLKSSVSTVLGFISRESLLTACNSIPDMAGWIDSISRAGLGFMPTSPLKGACPLFDGLSTDILTSLGRLTLTRVYFQDETIMTEGTGSEEFFFLVSGRAQVDIAGRAIQTVSSPYGFGELGLLRVHKICTCTVTARSVCLVRILFGPAFQGFMSRFMEPEAVVGECNQVSRQLRGRGTLKATYRSEVAAKLKQASCFKDVNSIDPLANWLAKHVEGRVFFQGQTILHEGTEERCVFVLILGTAKAVKSGEIQTMTIENGSVFGHMDLITPQQRVSSIIAAETCYVEVLHQSVVIRGVELFPEAREDVLFANHHAESTTFIRKRDRRSVIEMMMQTTFFQGVSKEFMNALSAQAEDRIFLKGDTIIEQGQSGRSMFVVVSGTAAVFQVLQDTSSAAKTESWIDKVPNANVMKRIKVLGSGAIFGELAMLGVNTTRAATIQAETLCCLWEVSLSAMDEILAAFPEVQHKFYPFVMESMESSVSKCITALPILHGFDQNFRAILGLNCERRVYFPQQTIARIGAHSDGLMIMNVGEASISKKGIHIATMDPGSHFGASAMLGITKMNATDVLATRVCHVVIVSQEAYRTSLKQYPAPEAAAKLVRSERDALREFRKCVQRKITESYIMSQVEDVMANVLGLAEETDLSIAQRLETVFVSWKRYTRTAHDERKAMVLQARRENNTDFWIFKMQKARDQRVEKDKAILRRIPLRGSVVGDTQEEQQTGARVAWHFDASPIVTSRHAASWRKMESFFPPMPAKRDLVPLAPYADDSRPQTHRSSASIRSRGSEYWERTGGPESWFPRESHSLSQGEEGDEAEELDDEDEEMEEGAEEAEAEAEAKELREKGPPAQLLWLPPLDGAHRQQSLLTISA